MLHITTKIFENNDKFLPESRCPLRHPKKNHSVTFCQLSSRLCPEPLLSPQNIINIGGLADLRSLSSSKHLLVPVSLGLHSQACTDHCWPACWHPLTCPPPEEGKEPTNFLLPGALYFKSPLLEAQAQPKPVGASSFPANEGQCWPCFPLHLFQPPCLSNGAKSPVMHALYKLPSLAAPAFTRWTGCF